MARGFLSGAAWGAVLSVLGVGVLSVAGPPPMVVQPTPDLDAPGGMAADAPAEDMAPKVAGTDEAAAPQAETPTTDAASAPDTLAALAEEARQPAKAPETADLGDAPSAPSADGGTGAALPTAGDTGVARPSGPGATLTAPDADTTALKPETPAEPAEIASAAPSLETPQAPDENGEALASRVEQPALPEQPAAPDSGAITVPDAPAVGDTPAPVEAGTGVTAPSAPETPASPSLGTSGGDDAPLPGARPTSPEADGADGLPDADGPADAPAPQVTALVPSTTDEAGDRPRVGQPARTLVPASTPRLPSVTAEGGEAAAGEDDQRPVVLFAEPIEVAADRPRMAIVLIDDGSGPIGAEVLDGFPYPVTVAVDPTSEVAQARAADYRALGLEVMALAEVPQGAQPQDVEVTLAALLSAVPEAVGILEAREGSLQGSSAVSDQVAAILGQTGHGLVLFSKGLNAGATLAAKAGVPAATVFRDFDGNGQDPKVMRRFLDQAAFKARQENGVVMVGRLRPDTISALLLWGLQDRAAQVGLVPVSMVLNADR
ncbi:divergent polysaccharide deacetylase family protein [Pseudaestuariivita atlantica]|uniref:Divergent polysaccharide deacetylase n=1 Tax=Pseudaestuariivita atlantica TaxID=1317121 RepID=A0A0L1JMJ7_9RHOB|nr:divergent polysaccharide deacetylase family protein [Pseudaestuariivita atlantica]KNG92975.1 hypothetical protein ATO11_13665 [Pseudaestuariivita atlantica]